MRPDVLAEHALARRLRQVDIDRLLDLGVPPLALTRTWFLAGAFIARDRVAFDGQGRFEFERHRAEDAVNAYVLPVFDAEGHAADIFGFRPGKRGLWLGAVDVLGAEHLFAPRVGDEPLDVWPDVLPWLAAERKGIVVVNPMRAFEALRCAGPLRVQTIEQGQALRHVLTQELPRIVVREKPAEPVQQYDRFAAQQHGCAA